jgi:hypothetical protein
MPANKYAGVVVDQAHPSLDKLFHYSIPENLAGQVQVGVRVQVPFGRRHVQGYVLSLDDEPGVSEEKIKPIRKVLIANELGKYTVPENDTLGAVTQLITGYATGQISQYMEFYEFMPDRVLIGVPDYVPYEVIEGPLKVLPSSFGKLSESILNVSRVKTGKITLARLGHTGNKYEMHIVTGTAVEPRSWEEVGWDQPSPQLPSLEVILDSPVVDFAHKVMSQHYIVTYGDNTAVLKDICKLLDIKII